MCPDTVMQPLYIRQRLPSCVKSMLKQRRS
nr:MAG TPA: hypothetical protein [Caudoviricetes sp.]